MSFFVRKGIFSHQESLNNTFELLTFQKMSTVFTTTKLKLQRTRWKNTSDIIYHVCSDSYTKFINCSNLNVKLCSLSWLPFTHLGLTYRKNTRKDISSKINAIQSKVIRLLKFYYSNKQTNKEALLQCPQIK